MKIIKYSRINDDGRNGVLSVTGGGSSTSSGDSGTSGSRGDVGGSGSIDLNRTLWGQDDTGGDIYGDMEIDGDIIIRRNTPEYDPEEPDEDLSPFGGNITMDGKLTAADIEANEIYATQHLYVPDPNTGIKTDILDLLIDYDTRITKNKTDIATNKTAIASLKSLIDSNTVKIDNLEDEVKQLSLSGGSGLSKVVIDNNVVWEGIAYNDTLYSGFIMKGGDEGVGLLEINTHSLPYYTDFMSDAAEHATTRTFSATVTGDLEWHVTESTDETQVGMVSGVYYVTTPVIEIGTFQSGHKIHIDSVRVEVISSDGTLTDVQTGVSILRDNTAWVGTTNSYYYGSVPANGLYSLQLSCSAKHACIIQNGQLGKATVKLTCNYTIPPSDYKGTINPDGIAYSYNNIDKFMIGPDGAFFKYGKYQLGISTEGITVSDGTVTKSLL